MKQKTNPVIAFFASVKLTLFLLFILAATSIFGTLIPQDKASSEYIKIYGEKWAAFFQVLDLDNMYHSWWFLVLLTMLSLNIIVCTLKRLPHVWKIVVLDNLQTKPERLAKMSPKKYFTFDGPASEAVPEARKLLVSLGRRVSEKSNEGYTLLFAQKGAWTRLGVYAVHVSILIIFIGAIIGVWFGYKAFVMLPAASTTNVVYETGTGTPIPLEFNLRCDNFYISFYDTGAPKEFRSDLVIVKDNNEEILTKSIIVNDPLNYNGLTFYQASYQAMEGQLFSRIKNNKTGATTGVPLRMRNEVSWEAEKIKFGVLNYDGPDMRGNYRFKIWFSDAQGPPSEFWMPFESTVTVERPQATYDFTLGQHYATGLQVAKDPGVWWVYIGCAMMLLGITVAFFLSHQRIWIYITEENGQTKMLLSGSANKNKLSFVQVFDAFIARITNHERFTPEGLHNG